MKTDTTYPFCEFESEEFYGECTFEIIPDGEGDFDIEISTYVAWTLAGEIEFEYLLTDNELVDLINNIAEDCANQNVLENLEEDEKDWNNYLNFKDEHDRERG